jgi:hypothetical protein
MSAGNNTLDFDGTSTGEKNEDLRSESEAESDENEDADDDEHGCFLSAEEVANLQSETRGDIYVDVYPGPCAGAIHSQGILTTKEFENVLGGLTLTAICEIVGRRESRQSFSSNSYCNLEHELCVHSTPHKILCFPTILGHWARA